jgi:hypothetical protein
MKKPESSKKRSIHRDEYADRWIESFILRKDVFEFVRTTRLKYGISDRNGYRVSPEISALVARHIMPQNLPVPEAWMTEDCLGSDEIEKRIHATWLTCTDFLLRYQVTSEKIIAQLQRYLFYGIEGVLLGSVRGDDLFATLFDFRSLDEFLDELPYDIRYPSSVELASDIKAILRHHIQTYITQNPIAICVSPSMSNNEIVNFVVNNDAEIKRLQKRYLSDTPDIKTGKKKRIGLIDYVLRSYRQGMPIVQIVLRVGEKYNDRDIDKRYIQKIISDYNV